MPAGGCTNSLLCNDMAETLMMMNKPDEGKFRQSKPFNVSHQVFRLGPQESISWQWHTN